jgi:hypothetical protein
MIGLNFLRAVLTLTLTLTLILTLTLTLGVRGLHFNYLKDAITQYTKSIGKSGTYYTLQALPRILTLWLSFTALNDGKKEEKGDIHDLNNRSLAVHNRTVWITKKFLERITLTMQFISQREYLSKHHHHHHRGDKTIGLSARE